VLEECRLDRVKLPVRGETLGRDDLGAVVRDSEREAAVYPPALEQDGAGATLPVVAALLRAGDREVLAQEVEQRGARVDGDPMLAAVDLERDLHFHADSFPRLSRVRSQKLPAGTWGDAQGWPCELARRSGCESSGESASTAGYDHAVRSERPCQ
jgi:hypothetical protein